jgi:uncharacterized protein (DUF58 family)
VLVLGAAALAAAWVFGSRPLVPAGVGLLLAALGARLWARLARGHTAVVREPGREEHVEGDDVRIRYRLHRRGALAWGSFTVREHVGRYGEQRVRLRGGRGELRLAAVPRGRFPLERGQVALEDPLGLEQVVVPVPATPPLVVVPRVTELAGLFSDAGRRDAHGGRMLLHRPSGYDLHSVREYEQGESLRKVHWPTTARRGQLMVKELEDTARDGLVVLLDCDAGTVAGPLGAGSFDEQVRVAASLLRAHVARGRRSALVLGRRDGAVVHVSSLETDWTLALHALAAVEPDGDRPLDRVLADERNPAARSHELVVVSGGIGERAASRLVAFRLAGKRVAVVWVDSASYATGRHTTPPAALLRVSAAGIQVAVVRRGDDLRTVLGGAPARRASA